MSKISRRTFTGLATASVATLSMPSISFGALARDTQHRTEIVNRLVENRIETRIFSAGNLGVHPFWVEKYGKFEDVMSNRIHACGFFVPNYPELTNDDIDEICRIIKGER